MIRRRPREQVRGKTGQDRWLVSYADLVTLLFGFFLVMYSVSHVSEQKYRTLTDALAATFSNAQPAVPDAATVSTLEPSEPTAALAQNPAPVTDHAVAWLAGLEQTLSEGGDRPWLQVRADEQWVEIDLQTQFLYQPGSAEPSVEAGTVFAKIASMLAPLNQAVEVAGHTDNTPINNSRFASNWELSAARAASAARLLASAGVAAEHLSAVGFGEFRPLADNATERGRALNRRVVIRLARPTQEALASINQRLATEETVAPTAGSPADNDAKEVDVAPRRLPHGGLLFSNNPKEKPAVRE